MSQDPKPIKKKVTVNKPVAGASQRRTFVKPQASFPLLFSKDNYMYMAIGVGLIALGMILMLGGSMKDPNQWDESVIYSFRRITLAPIIILAGLATEIYAIFKK
ncbi:MAG: DUF3098 domain-containing protein [Saprospiraceae bacterium]